MHLGAHVRGDQADDAFGVGCGEREARRLASRAEAVEPQRTVGIEEDLDDLRILQRGGDGRPHRRAQHARAAIAGSGGGVVRGKQDDAHDGCFAASSLEASAWPKNWLSSGKTSSCTSRTRLLPRCRWRASCCDELLEARAALRTRRFLVRFRYREADRQVMAHEQRHGLDQDGLIALQLVELARELIEPTRRWRLRGDPRHRAKETRPAPRR